jgi:hypothetical protein
MSTGSWFLVLEFKGFPTVFISIVPFFVDNIFYLAFKEYNQGEIYAALFNDPVPADKSQWSAWLDRGHAVMSSLAVDSLFAEKVNKCSFEIYDSHTFFNDYLIHTDADSVKKEFWISFSRQKIHDSAFQFTGKDSIAVLFSSSHIANPDGDITTLPITRTTGASMIGDQFFPGTNYEGKAYLIPMGIHSKEKIRSVFMPEINVIK